VWISWSPFRLAILWYFNAFALSDGLRDVFFEKILQIRYFPIATGGPGVLF